MIDKTSNIKLCRRFNIPFQAHELTFCCLKKRPFLSKDIVCHFLIESIIRAQSLHQFDIWAYVFMPNHVHILIWPKREIYSISNIMLSIKQSSSRKAIIHLRKKNPDGLKFLATGFKDTPYRLWMDGGGYDRNFVYSKAIISSVHYIHNNPVRRGLSARPEDWKWSSAIDWSGFGGGPIPINRDSFPAI
ncbi:conserved hypothetical protein [Candidatus Zixiibacteriota bacterium]|nr:conserved hypothetical protein [candidate division Zixibacteria bacterium]